MLWVFIRSVSHMFSWRNKKKMSVLFQWNRHLIWRYVGNLYVVVMWLLLLDHQSLLPLVPLMTGKIFIVHLLENSIFRNIFLMFYLYRQVIKKWNSKLSIWAILDLWWIKVKTRGPRATTRSPEWNRHCRYADGMQHFSNTLMARQWLKQFLKYFAYKVKMLKFSKRHK